MTNNTSTFTPSTQIINGLELDPRFFIGEGPAPIDIEPGDPIFQEIAELLRASKPEADGLTATGPTMPAFDRDESMESLTPVEEFFVTPLANAAEGFRGLVLGAFGFDVDESEPYIPEVGVDALA